MFIDHNTIGITAIGNAAKMSVRAVIGKNHIRAELLEAVVAMTTGPVRMDHATDGRDIARLIFGNGRADFRHPPDDLMTGNNRVSGGHEFAPFVAHRVEIGVTNTAE